MLAVTPTCAFEIAATVSHEKMLNRERAIDEAERRFPDCEADAMCTCGVYRIALRPKGDAPFDPLDPRWYAKGTSYERALALLAPPPRSAR